MTFDANSTPGESVRWADGPRRYHVETFAEAAKGATGGGAFPRAARHSRRGCITKTSRTVAPFSDRVNPDRRSSRRVAAVNRPAFARFIVSSRRSEVGASGDVRRSGSPRRTRAVSHFAGGCESGPPWPPSIGDPERYPAVCLPGSINGGSTPTTLATAVVSGMTGFDASVVPDGRDVWVDGVGDALVGEDGARNRFPATRTSLPDR